MRWSYGPVWHQQRRPDSPPMLPRALAILEAVDIKIRKFTYSRPWAMRVRAVYKRFGLDV